MPYDYSLYPPNWPAIRQRILFRARSRCEWPQCGAPNGWWAVWVSVHERKFFRPAWTPRPGLRTTKIVLTIAHKDHYPSNNADENLAAWCQYHHLLWDREIHAQHARETCQRKRAEEAALQLSLFF
jgi:hypothetical protein